MSNDIPQWAKERARKLANEECGRHDWFPDDCDGMYATLTTLARYIAKHEEPPVDPDLIKAREICARVVEGIDKHFVAAEYRKGIYDNLSEVQFALTALKEARNV